MGKKLAIKGHPTRGKEVIELLEMLGGDNVYKQWGKDAGWYIIEGGKILYKDYIFENDYITFSLDEFYAKYPYKVGDKVIDEADGCPGVVCEMKWDEGLSDMKYCVAFGNGIDFGWFANDSINYFKIKKDERSRKMKIWKKHNQKENMTNDELRMPLYDDDKLATEVTIMGKKILPPDGYLVGKITQTDNGMLVEYVEKKPEYPKTYEECEKILGLEDSIIEGCLGYEYKLLNAFQKLLMCRDAYWKVAGEELESSKPWEPDWNESTPKYTISVIENKLVKQFALTQNYIFAFPTEEMRDAFYENFKKEIEQCKELL